MKKKWRLLVLSCTLLYISSCDNPKKNNARLGPKEHNNTSKIDLSLTGEELFYKHCKICHGIEGNLEMNGAKDLKKSSMSLEERMVIITHGKNAMTPFKKILSKEEIQKVARYCQTFAEK